MQHTIPAMLLAALLAGACDPVQSDAEPVAETAEDAKAIFYAGERFTIDELGEAPPYLVSLANGEVHGFDAEFEAESFMADRSSPRDLAAPDAPTAVASQLNVWADIWGWQTGSPAFGFAIPQNVDYLGGILDWNDRISAVYNQSPYWVVLCEHAGQGGSQHWIEPGAVQGDLRYFGWNDRASSFHTP